MSRNVSAGMVEVTMASTSKRAGTECSWEESDRLVSVDDVLACVLAAVRPLPPVERSLLDALGRVTAGVIHAPENLPAFTNSAMDGFAVRSADTSRATQAAAVALTIIGTIAAGDAGDLRLEPGQAARIMTGAPVPEGADAVVRFEEIDEAEGTPVRVRRPVAAGENVRLAGEDIRAGDPAVAGGTALSPSMIGLLAALGATTVRVHRQPRVAILSTGNELVSPGGQTGSGRVRDSNSVMLAALVTEAGGLPLALGATRDEMDDLRAALRCAVVEHDADLVLTSGGVSIGHYDMVKNALQAEGRIALWQVRMKPGKPLAFGDVRGVPLLGLPGNPVAAAISFLQFGRPAIRRMLGHEHVMLPTASVSVSEAIANPGGRRHYVRVRLTQAADSRLVATPVSRQGAGILSSLAMADGLLVVPEDHSHVPAGSRGVVQILRSPW